jgi:hypothetical protein
MSRKTQSESNKIEGLKKHMITSKEKKKNFYRTIGGILFGVFLLLFSWLMIKGLADLSCLLSEVTEHVFWARVLIVLIVFLLIVVVAVAKVNVGGDALGIAMRELYRKKRNGKKDEENTQEHPRKER